MERKENKIMMEVYFQTFELKSGTKAIIQDKKATLFYIFDMDN